MRPVPLSVLAALALAVSAPASDNFFPPKASPAQMAVRSQVVVVGKVTTVPKDLIEAPSPFADGVEGKPGEKVTHKYKVAVVTIETALAGANGRKELKVGVIQPKPGEEANGKKVEMKDGQRLLLFLTKHPHADLYLTPHYNDSIPAPIDLGTAAGKKALAEAERALAIVADPLKSLKSDKASIRTEAAVILVMRYCASPEYGVPEDTFADRVPVDAEEGKLILKGLAEGTWKMIGDGNTTAPTDNPYHAFEIMPFGDPPPFADPLRTVPPGGDYAAHAKDIFVKWLAGAGKDFRFTKPVPKKAGKK